MTVTYLEKRVEAAERMHGQLVIGQRRALVDGLRRFREGLEADMAPEPWVNLKAPAVLLLADVCEHLCLGDAERAEVLGELGERTLAETLNATFTVIDGREPK